MSSTGAALPSADCDGIEKATVEQDEPLKLSMFMPPLTAAEIIERTLRYAKDPKQYLIETLGQAEFKAKRDVLSISSEVNFDYYGVGTTRQQFEAHIAKLFGKKHGRFFLTGVQAQLAALKTYAERSGRSKVAWHVSSHLETAEQEAYSRLYGLERTLLGSRADALPTVDEIQKVASLPEQDRPAAMLIEVPNRVLGCQTYSFTELASIAKICRDANIALHCDGARLWEIEPYYMATARTSFQDICSCFDSVYVSFYKGLGGVAGAMLVHHDAAFMEEAKLWQRRAGGTAFTLGVEVIDCQRAFNEMIATFGRKREKMIEIVEGIKEATSEFRTGDGKQIISFMPETAMCAQILSKFQGFSAEELLQARDRVQESTGVRVFERLRPKQTVDQRMKAQPGDASEMDAVGSDNAQFMEWMMMSVTEKIENHVFVDAYVNLCRELVGGSGK